jgi:hypothetical protein
LFPDCQCVTQDFDREFPFARVAAIRDPADQIDEYERFLKLFEQNAPENRFPNELKALALDVDIGAPVPKSRRAIKLLLKCLPLPKPWGRLLN